ncbi:MAG: hypothetical protein N2746_00220 [Deltaproteobacteria bacterium]|nr:hypothetical protein [Deltaproteobacteria bacterium]
MRKILVLTCFAVWGTLLYLSCSEDTSQPDDTQIKTDIGTEDTIEIRDEFIIPDTTQDNIEISDTEPSDVISDILPDKPENDTSQPDGGITDIGVEVEDVITDVNPLPPAKIIAGSGIDITYNGKPRQIRIDNTYNTVKDIKMSVPDSRVPYYLRVDELHFDLLFGDTDGSKNLSDGDKLIRIIISNDFYGETEGGTSTKDPLSKAKGEFGNSDHQSTMSIEGKEYTLNFYFKKGINIATDSSQIITGFTIYRPQRVVPSSEIDYENTKVLGITADIALFMSAATKISEMRNILGPEDVMVEDTTNKLIYYNYLSIGFTAIDSQTNSGDVKTITLYPPYFGKLKGTSLTLGASKNNIESFFNSKYGMPKTLQQGDATIYYYVIKTKDLGLKKYDICLGFIYNQNDNVAAILVGLPIEKK